MSLMQWCALSINKMLRCTYYCIMMTIICSPALLIDSLPAVCHNPSSASRPVDRQSIESFSWMCIWSQSWTWPCRHHCSPVSQRHWSPRMMIDGDSVCWLCRLFSNDTYGDIQPRLHARLGVKPWPHGRYDVSSNGSWRRCDPVLMSCCLHTSGIFIRRYSGNR